MCGMQDNNVVDWEYADEFYEESSKTTVRSFEEIAKEPGTFTPTVIPRNE